MIRVRQYTPTQIKLFDPNNNFVGFINNQTEFLQVRVDIAEQQLEGYYCIFGSYKIDINSDGSLVNELPSGINWNTAGLLARRLLSHNRNLNIE